MLPKTNKLERLSLLSSRKMFNSQHSGFIMFTANQKAANHAKKQEMGINKKENDQQQQKSRPVIDTCNRIAAQGL